MLTINKVCWGHEIQLYSRCQSIYPAAQRICAALRGSAARYPGYPEQRRNTGWRTCNRGGQRSKVTAMAATMFSGISMFSASSNFGFIKSLNGDEKW